MRELEQQAQEKAYNELFASFGDGDGMVETQEASRAKRILETAKLAITLDEMKELEHQATERVPGFLDDMVETEDALDAKRILEKVSIIGETQRTLFTTQDIGKATLEQQKQTQEKMEEDKSQSANQRLLEGELGKE